MKNVALPVLLRFSFRLEKNKPYTEKRNISEFVPTCFLFIFLVRDKVRCVHFEFMCASQGSIKSETKVPYIRDFICLRVLKLFIPLEILIMIGISIEVKKYE